jgi:hypothetical protein
MYRTRGKCKDETLGQKRKRELGRYKHLAQVDDAPHLSTDQEEEELALFFAENIK